MKNDKVDFDAKVVPRPISLATKTGSPAEKKKTTSMGSCEKSTKPVSGEVAEICALLKLDLLENMDACAELIGSVRRKTTILAIESVLIDQEDTKAVNEVAKT
ncbi:hypothetical protein DVH24_033899 [Malus domestica]|uniref:Uncharacterized protein n=1 Tax=Malus domestica TaxID=3750 RepID=A0A498KU64_MALDO|nr:hypothetical protein DVH24_033899 [Malus domestica]